MAAMIDLIAAEGHIAAPDRTPIAWFREAPGTEAAPSAAHRPSTADDEPPPLVLVHGTTADHTTFRRFGPRMAETRPVFSIDRRGRGASRDTLPYSIEREFDDVASVADALAAATGGPIDALGHSYGGRCAMGAALLTGSIRRVVAYEGAVQPGVGDRDPELLARLERLLAEGRPEELLEVFLREAVDFSPAEWEAFRTSPTFPARVAAAGSVTRELRAGASNGSALERYQAIAQPVLLVIGSESPPFFRAGAVALAARLAQGRLAVIEGARHAAHHTHVEALAALVEGFLDQPDR
jgi:pimeloyl-ACP methyl ester carboxylesterase